MPAKSLKCHPSQGIWHWAGIRVTAKDLKGLRPDRRFVLEQSGPAGPFGVRTEVGLVLSPSAGREQGEDLAEAGKT